MKTKELKKQINKLLNKTKCLSIEPEICPDCKEIKKAINKLLNTYGTL